MKYSYRDMENYTDNFYTLPFEPIQSKYRRETVLREIKKIKPQNLLEIGCGNAPLFIDLPDNASTVIEPSRIFAQNAKLAIRNRSNVTVHECLIEDFIADAEIFDMIIASCVLHEVPNALKFLSSIHRLCIDNTILHINVPNARSLHRLLAVAMGLISNPFETSETQQLMQQRPIPYDLQSLKLEVEQAGFNIIDQGGIFLKPFTHKQMQYLVDSGFFSYSMLEGLAELGNHLPELCSEIWINVKISK